MPFTEEISQPNNQIGSINIIKPPPVDYTTANLINAATKIGTSIVSDINQQATERKLGEFTTSLEELVQEAELRNDPETAQVIQAQEQLDTEVKETIAPLEKLRKAQQQGRMTQRELQTRSTALVRQAINQNPRLADDFRQAARNVLGYTPSEKSLETLFKASDRAEELEDAANESLFNASVNAGVLIRDVDGSLDFDEMVLAGERIQQQDYAYQLAKRKLDLESNKYGSKLTFDQRKQLETDIAVSNKYDPLFDQRFSAVLSSVPLLQQSASTLTEKQQIETIAESLGQAKSSWFAYLDSAMAEDNIPIDNRKEVRDVYLRQFATLEGLFTGTFSQVETNSRQLEILKGSLGLDAINSAKMLFQIQQAGGSQASGAIFSQEAILNQSVRTKLQEEVTNIISNPNNSQIVDLSNTFELMQGNLNLEALNPEQASKVVNNSVKIMRAYDRKSGQLDSTELNSWRNQSSELLRAATRVVTSEQINNAAKVFNTAGWRNNFKQFSSDPANRLDSEILADTARDVSLRTIQRNVTDLGSDIERRISDNTYKYRVEFNPSTGRFEANRNLEALRQRNERALADGRNPEAFSQQFRVPQDVVRKVQTMNESMDTLVSLKQYDNVLKDMSEKQVREIVGGTSGIPIKEGMVLNLEELPQFKNETEQLKSRMELFQEQFTRVQQQLQGISTDIADTFLEREEARLNQ